MKKILSLALALAMTLSLAACGGKMENPQQGTPTGGKLVVYSALNGRPRNPD